MNIKKAVITAAGYGTRMLPATKAMPKEMLPILNKPAIQYIVEECVAAGITDILIVLSRGKHIIEDHFDRSPDLERKLWKNGIWKNDNEKDLYNTIKNISSMANITYVRQSTQLGLGHAVLCAKNFAGGDPVAVLYGDDIIIGEDPAIGQLCRAYDKYEKGVVGIKEVPTEDVMKYSSMKLDKLADGYFEISDMIEKPAPDQIFSNYAILGRCILPAKIFDILEHTHYGRNDELQLTDAMKTLALRENMIGVDFTGTRYDMGNKLGVLKANIEIGLSDSDINNELTDYIKNLAQTL